MPTSRWVWHATSTVISFTADAWLPTSSASCAGVAYPMENGLGDLRRRHRTPVPLLRAHRKAGHLSVDKRVGFGSRRPQERGLA